MNILLKRFFSTTIVYYFLIGFIIFFSVDGHKAKANRLDTLKGWAFYPVKYLDHNLPFQEKSFRYAKKYFQLLINLMKDHEKADRGRDSVSLSRAYAMIAFCDYYLGKDKEAIDLFKEALRIEPRHFWFNYNLGVIYFRLGDYENAISYLQKSFSLNEENLNASMNMDFYGLWAPKVAEGYKKVSFLKFYEVIGDSYKICILAYERLNNSVAMKELSWVAIHSGLAKRDKFFDYYAGLSSQKSEVGEELFDLKVHPTLYFALIGQEKNLIQRWK